MHSDEWPVLNDVAKAINYEKAGYVDDGRCHRPTSRNGTCEGNALTYFNWECSNRRALQSLRRSRSRERQEAIHGRDLLARPRHRRSDPARTLHRGRTVADYGSKSQYVSLDSCSPTLLKQTQHLLLSFGIKSKIYKNRRCSLVQQLPRW